MKHKKIWFLLLFACLLLAGRSDVPVPLSPVPKSEPINGPSKIGRQPTASKRSMTSDADPMPFPSQILAENSACSVAVTGVEMDDIWGYQLQVELVNKTKHCNLIFMVQDVSVNNTPCDPSWACEVPAGQRTDSEIIWLSDLLAEKGISKVSELLFTLQIYDSENLEGADLLRETIVLFQE